MPDTKGYYNKYNVTRTDGQEVGRTFVIEIDKDPDAKVILDALIDIYGQSRPELASDLYKIALELK